MIHYLVLPRHASLDIIGWVELQREHEKIRKRLANEYGPKFLRDLFRTDTGLEAVFCENVGALSFSLSLHSDEPIVLSFEENEML